MDPLPIQYSDYREALDAMIRWLPGHVQGIIDNRRDVDATVVMAAVRPAMEVIYANVPTVTRSMPLSRPVLYEIYRPSVAAMETRVAEAVILYLIEIIRVRVLRWALDRDRLFELPAVVNATDNALLPYPQDLEEWGRKATHGRIKTKKAEEPYRIELDAKRVSADLRTAMVTALYDVMRMSAPKGHQTVQAVVQARARAHAETQRQLTDLLNYEFPRVLIILLEISQFEATNIIPSYEQSLRTFLEDIGPKYLDLVKQALNTNELQRTYGVLFGTRLEQISSLFESYRNDAPLVDPLSKIPAAPTKRDLSLLFQTASGTYLAQMYEASRRVLPPASTKGLKFLDEIPRNLVDTDLSPVGLVSSPHPMDRVQRYFESQTVNASELKDAYQRLKARTALAARP